VASRIVSGVIVCFWIVMTSLLIRLEVNPDNSNLLSLPASHVFKLMFMHQQISDLSITQNGKPVGNLMLHPKLDADLNKRTLIFTGGFSFLAPGAQKKQRITWDGSLVMDRAFNTLSLNLTASLQDPPYRIHLDLDPLAKRADYDLQLGTHPFKHSSVPLNQEGLSSLLRDELGIDPAILQNMPVTIGTPTLTAKQTEMTIRKEKVVAYLLTFKQGDTTLAEIYVSQLGQVLTAKTLIGYNLSTEDLTPP
jgi:hypothetical protein